MHAILTLYDVSTKVRDYSLNAFPLVIGRSSDADVSLDDRWLSRRHCQIDAIDGRLVVRDLGSKHGTLVNDSLISESTLMPGDKLNVGLSTFFAVYDIPVGHPAGECGPVLHHR